MKKTMLYVLITIAITAVAAIVIVGCNGDLGSSNEKMYDFLEKFRGEADSTVSKYIVRYDANGGKNDPPAPDTVLAGRKIRLPGKNTLTKDPLVFVGWNTESSGDGKKYGVGADYTPTSNVTLYAEWQNNGARYDVTVSSAGTGSYGGSSYQYDDIVNIYAGTALDGQQFKEWTATPSVSFASKNSPTTSFRMPAYPVTATAVFEAIPANKYAVTVLSDGSGMSGGGSYSSGVVVTINAGSDPFGHRFKNWTVTSGGVGLADANNRSTTFTMPSNAVTVTANFEKVSTYKVTVVSEAIGASKDSSYRVGDTVTINAGAASADRRFRNWTVTNGDVTLDNTESITTKFIMPANAVTVTANFVANTYTVMIVSVGTGMIGGGEYSPGTIVTIKAGTAPSGFVFKNWTSSNSTVVFTDANSTTTAFTMPPAAVTVIASFGGTLTDSRDGQTYGAVSIGNKIWMTKNLNYPMSNGSWCYGNADSNCVNYGRLYNWSTAKTVCPTGWHLPDTAEWRRLVETAGVNDIDDFGFSTLLGGYRDVIDGGFVNAGKVGYWWTATEVGNGHSYSRHRSYRGYVYESSNDPGYGFSVRCAKNE